MPKIRDGEYYVSDHRDTSLDESWRCADRQWPLAEHSNKTSRFTELGTNPPPSSPNPPRDC